MRRGSRKPHVQLSLDQARKPDGQHGGWRPGAGRPAKRGSVSHAARADEPARFPQHVTLRIKAGVPSLARDRFLKIIRAVVRASHEDATGRSLASGGGTLSSANRSGASSRRKHRRAGVASTLGLGRGFRIVEFNVLGNHLHLIVEAAGKDALSRGIEASA